MTSLLNSFKHGRLAGAAAASLALCGTPAQAQDAPGIVLTRVAAPTQVAARDGVLVWGAYDAAAGGFVLMQRTRSGVIRRVGPELVRAAFVVTANGTGRTEPRAFEVTLGTDENGALTAVYRRCAGPDLATCGLMRASLRTGAERLIPGTGGALRGAISGARVAWVVATPGGPDRLLTRTGPATSPTPALRPQLAERGVLPDRASIRISAVDVRGDAIAQVVDFHLDGAGEIAFSQIWLQRYGRINRVASVGTGGASSGFRQFLQPRIFHHSLVAYMQGRDQTNAVFRYSPNGRVLGSGSIGIRDTDNQPEVTGGQSDRGNFYFSTAPYQGIGCANFEGNPPGATCPVLDSGPLTLAPPAPRRAR